MANGKKINDLIINKLTSIETELKEVRQKDIPNIKIDMAVVKSESKTTAKIITAVGGLIAVATSAAIAFFK
jgi:hypothetical protein